MKKKYSLPLSKVLVAIALIFSICVIPNITGNGTYSTAYANGYTNWNPGHYLLAPGKSLNEPTVANGEYDQDLAIESNDGTRMFRGIQVRYNWVQLEPTKDNYDFSRISNDLSHLASLGTGQKLIIQLQTKSFNSDQSLIPDYLTGSTYGGGYYLSSDGAKIPIYWNTAVNARVVALIDALGDAFNGNANLEAINLTETALSQSVTNINNQSISPAYTASGYADAFVDQIEALHASFPDTASLVYTNYPANILLDLADAMRSNGVGIANPDLNVSADVGDGSIGTNSVPGSYAYFTNYWNFSSVTGHDVDGYAPLGVSVQTSDYYTDNTKTTLADVDDLFDYAHDKLNVNYIFWLDNSNLSRAVDYLDTVVTSSDKAGGLNSTEPGGGSNPPTTVQFAPDADAWVWVDHTNSNYGTDNTMATDKDEKESFMKFVVSGVTGTVQSATLHLYLTNVGQATGQVAIWGNSSTGWTEGGLKWSNKPSSTTNINSYTIPSQAGWVTVDVSSYITGNGTYSLQTVNGDTHNVVTATKEYSDSTKRPYLEISSQ